MKTKSPKHEVEQNARTGTQTDNSRPTEVHSDDLNQINAYNDEDNLV